MSSSAGAHAAAVAFGARARGASHRGGVPHEDEPLGPTEGSVPTCRGYAPGVSSETMPVSVGITLAHAALQAIAEDHRVDLLHIKGPAVDPSLLDRRSPGDHGDDAPAPRISMDADVLVRPSQVFLLLDAMRAHGWTIKVHFADGSAFEHASTMQHADLAPVDVHRRFPGIGLDPERAFDRLWAGRHQTLIAGLACWVPSVTAQRLILILNAVRGGRLDSTDLLISWYQATADERRAVDALAGGLDAEVALAAATGRLGEHRGAREHDLWSLLATGEGTRAQLWWARVRAEPSLGAALRTGVRLVLPKPDRIELALGRPPTRGDVARAYVDRASTVAREVGRTASEAWARARRHGGQGRPAR